MQGQNAGDVDAVATLDLSRAQLSEAERALLEYVKVLTLTPSEVRDVHVERLRRTGWTDEQIFEASFTTSLFAFINRMADAYGLDYPTGGWLPPDRRPRITEEETGGVAPNP